MQHNYYWNKSILKNFKEIINRFSIKQSFLFNKKKVCLTEICKIFKCSLKQKTLETIQEIIQDLQPNLLRKEHKT